MALIKCDVCEMLVAADPLARPDILDANGGLLSFGTNGAKWFCCGPCRAALKSGSEGAVCMLRPELVDVETLKGGAQ